MHSLVVQIIDSRKELPMKYKKIIEQNCMVNAIISANLEDAFLSIEELEPDLIIMSDSACENVNEICAEIRSKTRISRPVIVVLSKSSYLDDKLSALGAGADDFLSEPIDQSEFSARIFAHLRRQVEELSNPITELAPAQITYKMLKRAIKSNKDWALMYIDIDNFDDYKEIYGELASSRMLQSFTSILTSTIDSNDFVGQINEENFAILTSKYKADRIASFLNHAFDAIATKFYSKEDLKRGYLIMQGDGKAGHRTPLVSLSIGIISNEYRTYKDYKEVINAVKSVHKLAKSQPGSSFVKDRPRICGGNAPKEVQKKILIVENDAALAYLLSTTLDMRGYQTEAISNLHEVMSKIDSYKPDLILLDTGNESDNYGFEICRCIKDRVDISNIKLIVSTVVHDKERVLNTGADLYLPKPYELMTLYSWIEKFFSTV